MTETNLKFAGLTFYFMVVDLFVLPSHHDALILYLLLAVTCFYWCSIGIKNTENKLLTTKDSL